MKVGDSLAAKRVSRSLVRSVPFPDLFFTDAPGLANLSRKGKELHKKNRDKNTRG